MSVVYRAEDTDLNCRPVVVKILTTRLDHLLEYRRRFVREIRLVSTLQHPNIIDVYDATKRSQYGLPLFLVMPYVDGFDLRSLLASQGPLDLARTLRIVEQVASALDFAHQRGVVHRDVKPANILLSRETEHAYLCDFGIAKIISDVQHTATGVYLYTPGYAPPEVLPPMPFDAGSTSAQPTIDPAPSGIEGERLIDTFALGVVVYQCLTGRLPFDPTDLVLGARSTVGVHPPPVSMLRDDLPAALDDVMDRATAREPGRRYVSCRALVDALRDAAGDGVARTPPGSPVPPPAPPPVTHPPGAKPRKRLHSWLRTPRQQLRTMRSSRSRIAVFLALVLISIVVLTGWPPGISPGADGSDRLSAGQRERIPLALLPSCRRAPPGTGAAGASDVITCEDDGEPVTISLFDTAAAAGSAYAERTRDVDVPRGQGDCTAVTGAEHRYPGTSTAAERAGRVLCYSQGGTTSIVWTDDAARTLAWSSRPDIEDLSLRQIWKTWIGLRAFPTAEERKLEDLVDLDDCRRPSADGLETFRGVQAAVECDPPGSGASTVTYYTFADLEELRYSYRAQASRVKAPRDVYCDESAPGFLGDHALDLRSVKIGSLLCHRGPRDAPVMEWTVEPLLVMGRATGTQPKDLHDWWDAYRGPSQQKISEAVNRAATPAFPSTAEKALLDHVPPGSRVNCMRTPPEQAELNLGKQVPVAAVVCGPTSGASIVFYYQLQHAAAMRASYQNSSDATGAGCTPTTTDFRGESPYSEETGKNNSGRLACSTNSLGPYLVWTTDRLNIMVLAFSAENPEKLLEWWRTDAGPR
ncbi:serine/threonine-protein kinase [Parafrankia sp. FMc2]|uniref:serine/threonine-protein kinase n=1 Tax=Parafrankia sp. FMc2 TaxID=3233196 RepID=UPI0034D3EE45